MTWNVWTSIVTDRGCVRALNEDSACIVQPSDEPTLARRGVLVVVADGMGGHAAGEIASELAVETVRTRYYDAAGTPTEALREALLDANRVIHEHAHAHKDEIGMGTTCVALAVCGNLASVASVGDSRLYLIRAGGIYRMTVDDSTVSDLVRQGMLTNDEARHHADRNVLSRALGTHADVSINTWDEPFPVRADDTFVLCSDGLTDLVADEEILESTTHPKGEICQHLVNLAKQRGGSDNVTVALLRLEPQGSHDRAIPSTREAPVA
jgi:protein phosphatase